MVTRRFLTQVLLNPSALLKAAGVCEADLVPDGYGVGLATVLSFSLAFCRLPTPGGGVVLCIIGGWQKVR